MDRVRIRGLWLGLGSGLGLTFVTDALTWLGLGVEFRVSVGR
jgi:hypothetical protein